MTQGSHNAIPAPASHLGRAIKWARKNLFRTWLDGVVTILFLAGVAVVLPPLIQWAFIDTNLDARNVRECHQSGGACWVFIGEKARLMLFGLYSGDEWRPSAAIAILLTMIVAAARGWLRGRGLIAAVAVGAASMFILMHGGLFGMPVATTRTWGGLPLTLGLATISLVVGFPLGVLLALGRRSELPAIRILCVVYIEAVRGVPLITVLFMASVMLPLFLPAGENVDNVLRAQIGMIGFGAAYLAEVVRGGLQSVPTGQYEAADALGLSYWQKMRMIILPQALRVSIPPIVNTFIGIFKDTTLVIIVGLFDLLGATKAALVDGKWLGVLIEPYLFICIIYFGFCFTMSKYSQNLEKRLGVRRTNSLGDE